MIDIIVNGEKTKLAKHFNLQELLTELDLPTERVAIELNKDVVRRKDWASIQVNDKDKIEVIHFVGGG